LPSAGQALVIDTVGFINKLPHGFVDAFKSTLEEVHTADLLLHVVDASSPHAAEQADVVERVLGELDAATTPRITVLNKVDLLPAGHRTVPGNGARCVISARTGEGIPALLAAIDDALQSGRARLDVRIPAARGDLVARLHQAGTVLREQYEDGHVDVTALVPAKLVGQLRKELSVNRARAGARRQEES